MYLQLYIKRREKRMTQKQVAELLGVSSKSYRMKESGSSDFTISEGVKLSKHFEMSLDELFKKEFSEGA